MTDDDVLFGYRQRLFTLAEELGNVSAACRQMGISRSTYYAWKPKLERYGLDGLRVRERRRPRMPNQIGPHLEHRILAYSLAYPGQGPRRITAELRRPKWGGIRVSEHGVWLVLRRFNLNTRAKRLALLARHADPYERRPELAAEGAAHRGLLRPARRSRWTASSSAGFSGVEGGRSGNTRRPTSPPPIPGPSSAPLISNPSARFTAELCPPGRRRASGRGLEAREVTTDNGSEFRSADFGEAVEASGAAQRRIQAGRPNSNGSVERVQLTILEECWRPAFSRSLAPRITALRRDLDGYLALLQRRSRPHWAPHPGRVPADIVFGARKMASVR